MITKARQQAKRPERVERLDLRVPEYVKARIRAAASMTGRSMSDFIVAAALTHAEEVVESIERWTLNEDDSRFVLQLLAASNSSDDALRELLNFSEPAETRQRSTAHP